MGKEGNNKRKGRKRAKNEEDKAEIKEGERDKET